MVLCSRGCTYLYNFHCSQDTCWNLNKFTCPSPRIGKKTELPVPWCLTRPDSEISRKSLIVYIYGSYYFIYVRLQSPMVTPKFDGHAKVRWSAPKSDGLLEIGTPKRDGYVKVRRSVSYRHVMRKSVGRTRQSPMFRRLFTRHATPMLREKKLRLWCHVTRTLLVTSIITI